MPVWYPLTIGNDKLFSKNMSDKASDGSVSNIIMLSALNTSNVAITVDLLFSLANVPVQRTVPDITSDNSLVTVFLANLYLLVHVAGSLIAAVADPVL